MYEQGEYKKHYNLVISGSAKVVPDVYFGHICAKSIKQVMVSLHEIKLNTV